MTTLAEVPSAVTWGFAAMLGLIIGSFLNVVVHRVPAGASLVPSSACPACEAPIRPWHNVPVVSWLVLRGRCADCRAPISARYPLVEAGTALAFVAAAAWLQRVLAGPLLVDLLIAVAVSWFLAASIALTLIDLDTRRLPRVIVWVTTFVVAALLLAAAVVLGAPDDLWRALAGAAVLWLGYRLIVLVRPDGMGRGDVRCAALLGLILGWFGWGSLAVGAFAAFLLAGTFGVALILAGRARGATALAFGPWMFVGAWLGLIVGPSLADQYLSLSGLV